MSSYGFELSSLPFSYLILLSEDSSAKDSRNRRLANFLVHLCKQISGNVYNLSILVFSIWLHVIRDLLSLLSYCISRICSGSL